MSDIVYYGAVPIPDEDMTPSVEQGTDFGSAAQGGAPVEHTFTLNNDGSLVLGFTNWLLPAGFSFVGTPPSTLDAYSQTGLVIRLDTSTTGVKAGNVSFEWTRDGEPGPGSPYRFAVTGAVTGGGWTARRVSDGAADAWRGRKAV